METRKETENRIEKAVSKSLRYDLSTYYMVKIAMELLLDIRELLRQTIKKEEE